MAVSYKFFFGRVFFILILVGIPVLPIPPLQAVFHIDDRFWAQQNRHPKKVKNIFFQHKFSSLKAHAHYFTVLIYFAIWRAAKVGIFTHFTSINLPQCDVAKASTHYNVCILYRSPASFYEPLITVSLVWLPDCTSSCSYYNVKKFVLLPDLIHLDIVC